MTDRDRPDPPDEFIIGSTPTGAPPNPPPAQRTTGPGGAPVIGGSSVGRAGWDARPTPGPVSDDYGVIGDDDPDEYYDDDYYDDEYYEDAAPRQPLFYVFIGLAVLLGVVLVFLLFRLLSGDDSPTQGSDTDFNISIDSPLNDERVTAGEDVPVQLRANATEPIRTLQLLLEGEVVDEAQFDAPPENGIYSATLTFSVDTPDTYDLSARAIAESGASRDSAVIRVIAVESIDGRPTRITGEVISTVNARQGPGDEFTAVETLNAGTVVTVVGRTRDSQWLLLENETWIRRAAVQLSDSIDLVEVRQPTPTQPPATDTPEPSPSPSPDGDAPDFSPSDASLDGGGSVLRVTIANLSSNDYEGPLVVRVTGIGDDTLEQVFSVSLDANGSQSVEFDLPQPQSESVTVQVAIDVDGQVDEASEDNNEASFLLAPPVATPELQITSASIIDSAISVTVVNVGNDMAAANVVVTVALGGESNSASRADLALDFGQSATFNISRPGGSGLATITVSIGGEVVATGSVDIPDGATAEPTATATP